MTVHFSSVHFICSKRGLSASKPQTIIKKNFIINVRFIDDKGNKTVVEGYFKTANKRLLVHLPLPSPLPSVDKQTPSTLTATQTLRV